MSLSTVRTESPDTGSRLLEHDSTLIVGRSVSLTLGSDSLAIVDERASRKSDRDGCCGFLKSKSKETHAISLYNVLDADLSPAGLTITYAKPATRDDVTVNALQYPISDEEKKNADSWMQKLLNLAYGDAMRYKRLKVLINPFGGKGSASALYNRYAAPIFAAARCRVDVQTTSHMGHATEICEKIDVNAYDAIVCCSGDGLPYEVFNGLAKKANAREALAKLAVTMIPCGSGNAMAWNLCGTGSVSVAALAIVKGLQMPMDLVSITQGSTRTLSFLSQSFGIVADCDLGTDDIRWMGAHRFTYGFLVRLMQRTVYPCDLAIKVVMDDKRAIKDHYLSYTQRELIKRDPQETAGQSGGLPELRYGTVLDELPSDWEVVPGETMGNFYAGKMAIVSKDTNFFPAALPSDGLIDIVTVDGTVPRMTTLKMMSEVPNGGFFDMPEVITRKAVAYRLVPREKEGFISVDGEKVPFEAFQVEVHKGLGTVLSKSGHLYEAEGPRL
ncbi:putative sphingosine kinase (SphK) [Aspergillus chevalieri]|uniref:Sphinganine kinase lcb4 n=1 Tax=Aspergillus chevalieri TaxID=182096 RepID=A0A7R7ZKV1_ASPCH|nr:sphinganine kinase lcb4 [Aspergillus chevalieri]BCR86165.1 sphinganine kinase lcb4 [Aspergillus chevalieri]